MEKGGIVSAAVVKQDDRPDKRMYEIATDIGRHRDAHQGQIEWLDEMLERLASR